MDGSTNVSHLMGSKRPLVIAHRGYCEFAPENTIPSFLLAMAAGADLVELDYRTTKDGHLIVIHDRDLDRTTDARSRWGAKGIKVETRTAAELQSLDAGTWFDPKFAGAKLPRLTEALDVIQSGSVTLIERKAGDADDCVRLLRERALINRVIVQAFDWQYLRKVHELEPTQILGALGPPKIMSNGRKPLGLAKELNLDWLNDLQQTGAQIAVWDKHVSAEVIQLAHNRGLRVWVYTINEPSLANQLLNMGVDGLISNNISLIWRTLALRGLVGRA